MPVKEKYGQSFGSFAALEKTEALKWLTGLRRNAYERFQAVGFPTKAKEEWKTLSLEPLLGATFADESLKPASGLTERGVRDWSLGEETPRLVFLNGHAAPEFSSAEFLPHGVFLENLSENLHLVPDFVRPYLGSRVQEESNAFALVNTFSFKDGALVFIPPDTAVETPIHILFLTRGGSQSQPVFYPRILVVLGDRAKARVVVTAISETPGGYFSNAVSEVCLGEGASLDYSAIERGGQNGFRFSSNRFYLKKESVLELFTFSQGGAWTRPETQVEFGGDHASATIRALSVLGGVSQAFHHVEVNHRAGLCKSRQFYKNILSGQSKSEFNSLVRVYRDAKGSDTNQLNRNLLLSDTAQCFSKPRLQIDADDVSCTHGATVGQIEKDELFYLKARGLSEKEARFLLTYGFAEELIETVKPAGLRAALEALVREEIGQ
jgi:Fe-S cluster assembly protein SufD